MTQTAAPVVGLLSKLYIATVQGTAPTTSGGTVTGGTLIGGLTKITPPAPKWDVSDVTVLGQASAVKKSIRTLVDAGELMAEGFNESADAGQTAVLAAFNAAAVATYGNDYGFLIVEPIDIVGGQTTQGDYQAFNGIVTSVVLGESEPGKPVPFKMVVKLQTIPVYTTGS